MTAALLGTERRPPDLPPAGGALGDLLSGIREAGSGAERYLLSSASTLTLYRRAGKLPAYDNTPHAELCPPETLALCSPGAAAHLFEMLGGQYGGALLEWLEAAVDLGKHVTYDAIPALLDIGQAQPSYRPYILAAVGNRGRWLAKQFATDGKWGYVRDAASIETPDEESTLALWETGSREARLGVLQRLRARQPERARELLASVWKEESSLNRAYFLQAVQTDLSMDDEPFLEWVLDDKSKDVRAIAAERLGGLPESRFMQRMIEGVAPFISLKRLRQGKLFGLGASNKDYIEIALAQEYTPAMKRDSIEQKPSNPKMGERAYWLQQQLSRIPPSFWAERWEAEPHEIVSAAFQTKEWKDVLVEAWITATVRHSDSVWAEAFLARGLSNLAEYSPDRLVRLLPPERRDEIVTFTLNRRPEALYSDDMPVAVLWGLRKPWPPDVCRAVLRSVNHHMKNAPKHGNWQVSQSLATFAYAMTPAILQEGEAILTTTDATPKNLKEAVDEFLATLHFRRDMLRALAE